jgi:hypothetical protein
MVVVMGSGSDVTLMPRISFHPGYYGLRGRGFHCSFLEARQSPMFHCLSDACS